MHPLERKVAADSYDQPGQSPAHISLVWYRKLGIFLFIIVCFEVGAFLIVFPWTPQWESNSVANLFPLLRDLWASSYFRGALSGLGFLNIYISLGEVSRLRRSGGPRPPRTRGPQPTPPNTHPPATTVPPADKLKVSTL